MEPPAPEPLETDAQKTARVSQARVTNLASLQASEHGSMRQGGRTTFALLQNFELEISENNGATTGKNSRPKLNPDPSLKDHLQKVFKAPLVVVTGIAAVITIVGILIVDKRKFTVDTAFKSLSTEKDCERFCTTHTKETYNCTLEGNERHGLTFSQKWCLLSTQIDTSNIPCQRDESVFLALPESERARYIRKTTCTIGIVPPIWQPYVVMVTLMLCITMIVDGVAAEAMLFGACCFFTAVGIIDTKQAFGGLSSGSVVGLCLLFPIAGAIEETGLLEDMISVVLGNPTNFLVALMRMMAPVAFLSAFLSNTAIVAMMIPIVVSWSRRLDISAGRLLMPLSFAAQLGGSCTLIGGSHVLVARDVVDRKVYSMAFFDLAPAGTAIAVAAMMAMVVCLPLLRSSDVAKPPKLERKATNESILDEDDDDEECSELDALYQLKCFVRQRSAYQGANAQSVCLQLSRLPGVHRVTNDVRGSLGEMDPARQILMHGSVLRCWCTAEGIASLRLVRALTLWNQIDLGLLGSRRRDRHLYEVVVRPTSPLVGNYVDIEDMRNKYGCCAVGVQGRDDAYGEVKASDVVLLEADKKYITSREWEESFSVARLVPNSSPPRVGGGRDKPRAIVVCGGMLVLICLVTANIVELSYGAGLFMLVILLVRSRSVAQVYESIKAPVLLTIAGAFGVSKALEATGVGTFIASFVTTLASGYGSTGIRAAVYIVAVFLSMFINNSATIAILGPMIGDMAKASNTSVASLVWVLVFGAGSCFTTPLGYQTNMMVMKEGGYTFGDFMVFGAPLQLLHMIITLTAIYVVSDLFGFGAA